MSEHADMVRFWCRCGAKLKALPRNRGHAVTCPKCGADVLCPQQSTRAPAAQAQRPGAQATNEFDTTPPEEEPLEFEDGTDAGRSQQALSIENDGVLQTGSEDAFQVAPEPSGVEPPDEGLSLEDPLTAAGGMSEVTPAAPAHTCPGCGSQVEANSAICTQCGFDFRTGVLAQPDLLQLADQAEQGDATLADFTLGILKAFLYPFKDFGNIFNIAMIVSFILMVSILTIFIHWGIFLTIVLAIAGYYGAYVVNIVQTTMDGYDEPPTIPGISPENLFMPILWLGTITIVLAGPATLATKLATTNVNYIGLAIAAWVFAYLAAPMALLIIANTGSIRPGVIKGIFVSLFRNPGHYLFFLMLLGIGSIVGLTASGMVYRLVRDIPYVGWIAGPTLAELIPLYMLAVFGRMLGLFGRFRSSALDWGEGAHGGVKPLGGAAIVVIIFAVFSLAGFLGVKLVRTYVPQMMGREDLAKDSEGESDGESTTPGGEPVPGSGTSRHKEAGTAIDNVSPE